MADRLAAPAFSDEHHKLAGFADKWRGEELVDRWRWTVGRPAVWLVSARIGLDRFHLIQDTRP